MPRQVWPTSAEPWAARRPEYLLGKVVGRYCWLVSTCDVKAGAMCTLCRIGKSSFAARAAAGRCLVAIRFGRDMRDETKAGCRGCRDQARQGEANAMVYSW